MRQLVLYIHGKVEMLWKRTIIKHYLQDMMW